MKILDMTAGRRAIWFDKKNPLTTFLDIRAEMEPDIVCDCRELPSEVGTDFDLIVFDPPHVNTGFFGRMAPRYGHWTSEHIRSQIAGSAKEAHRVSKPTALMAFKWNNHSIKLQSVLDLMVNWEPLFGHMTKDGPGSQTYWVMLRRLP